MRNHISIIFWFFGKKKFVKDLKFKLLEKIGKFGFTLFNFYPFHWLMTVIEVKKKSEVYGRFNPLKHCGNPRYHLDFFKF